MKRSQASKSTGGKKAKQSAPQQSGAASAAKGAGWCSDCWALAQHPGNGCLGTSQGNRSLGEDACRGAHRLVDFTTAQKDVAAEMSDAQIKVDQVQQRMDTLTEAVLSSGPVLVARVPYVDSCCWSIDGGDIRITLASTVPLTAKDIQAVCEALEGLDLHYDDDGGMPTACVDISGLKAVMKKLPDYAQGQKCDEGDLQLDVKGHLTVGDDPDSRGDAKLLGRVDKKDVDNLCARTCGEGSDCRYKYKYNSHDEIGEGTTFENVRLAD